MEYENPEDQSEGLIIEDEPKRIRFDLIFNKMKHSWKLGLILILACGLTSLFLSPSGGFSGYAAETTLYTPASTTRRVDNRIYIISNNLYQLDNMVELIQSKMYQDAIAEELETENLNKYGTFTVSRIDKTDLISITAYSSSREQAEKLCEAIVTVMTEQLGKKVSINDMVSVDSVKSFSVSSPSTLVSSFVKGCLGGTAIWMIYVLLKGIGDRKFHSAEEVEEDLGLPVITVLPSADQT